MSIQQTVLRVQTNIPSGIEYTGTTSMTISGTNITYGGSGTQLDPYTGSTTGTTPYQYIIGFTVSGGTGTFYYTLNYLPYSGASINLWDTYNFKLRINHDYGMGGFNEYAIEDIAGNFSVNDGDIITILGGTYVPSGSTFNFYLIPNDNINNGEIIKYDNLDLYGDIPIKLNYSFAEIQDIAKRNSNYSIGLILPGSKKNNAFFETYYNVEANSLYFDVTKRVPIDILSDDEVYFRGYMKLNKVSVKNSQVEYDVTLFSTVADLYGKIGNNLLKDLNYNDIDWHFNHYFSVYNVASTWQYSTLQSKNIVPSLWMYPVVHNGYQYTGDTVNLSGGTTDGQTRLFTSTIASGFTNYSAFTSAGGKEFRINSPRNPILDNQLKPALNIYALLQLIFKTYGYSIKSEFFESPWFKLLYMYGFYSYDGTKFGYKVPPYPIATTDDIELYLLDNDDLTFSVIIVRKGTGVPVTCDDDVLVTVRFAEPIFTFPITYLFYNYQYVIPRGQTIFTGNFPDPDWFVVNIVNSGSTANQTYNLDFVPANANSIVSYEDGDYIDFSLVIDENIKQIDILSSIAKKFNLVIIPNVNNANEIIIEPYDYYIGSGNIIDWTDKLSYDKGWSVEPALNYIESEIILTDQEDGDEANKTFKDRNKLIYGENRVYNPTDFKSQTKKIETIFAPEVIRKWDENIGLPLGINYAGQSAGEVSGQSEKIIWKYTGLKCKPRLIFNNANLSPFLDKIGESFTFSGSTVNTVFFRIQPSDGVNPLSSTDAIGSFVNPAITHTMPMGNPDSNKINNDSICILFNCQEPDDIGTGISTFNTFSENDVYKLFYENRIDNLFNKNTRFLKGYFDLSINDVKNFRPNDIIKIQEKYFYLNKIEGFDVVNPELTKVELVQTNNRVRPYPYPTRYFKYQYCGDSDEYRFRTFFNPADNTDGVIWSGSGESINSIRRTYYYWSILYDYFVGALGGNVSGITSSYADDSTSERWAYTMTEITETEYDTITLNWYDDPNNTIFIDYLALAPDLNNYVTSAQNIWVFANQFGVENEKAFFNCAVDCATFTGYCATNLVTLEPAP